MNCTTSGCKKDAARGGKCWACIKARQRLGTTERIRHEHHPTPRDMVLEACIHIAEVDQFNTDAWDKAWHRLRMAMRRCVLGTRKAK